MLRETFKALSGLGTHNLHTVARRLTKLNSKGMPKVCIEKAWHNNVLIALPAWAQNRKWKIIIFTNLVRNHLDMNFLTGDEGHHVVNRHVWLKFKKETRVTKAKWTNLFEVATIKWLNKKRMYNHKILAPPDALQCVLDSWLCEDVHANPRIVLNFFCKLDGSHSLTFTC